MPQSEAMFSVRLLHILHPLHRIFIQHHKM